MTPAESWERVKRSKICPADVELTELELEAIAEVGKQVKYPELVGSSFTDLHDRRLFFLALASVTVKNVQKAAQNRREQPYLPDGGTGCWKPTRDNLRKLITEQGIEPTQELEQLLLQFGGQDENG
jgi:hypothetical protein